MAVRQETEVRRPGGITLIVVLAVINAIATIAGGIFVLLDHDNHHLLREAGLTENHFTAAGVAWIILGAIYLVLALALGRGSRLARLLFGIWAVLNLAGGLWALVALDGEQQAAGAFSAVIAFIVLYLLYGSDRDREYFLHDTR